MRTVSVRLLRQREYRIIQRKYRIKTPKKKKRQLQNIVMQGVKGHDNISHVKIVVPVVSTYEYRVAPKTKRSGSWRKTMHIRRAAKVKG